MQLNGPFEESADAGSVRKPRVIPFDRAEALPQRGLSLPLSQDQGSNRLSSEEGAGLDVKRAADIRTKILSGAYHSLDVAEQIARAILERGDLPESSGP